VLDANEIGMVVLSKLTLFTLQPMPSAWDDIRHDGSTNECYVEDGLAR